MKIKIRLILSFITISIIGILLISIINNQFVIGQLEDTIDRKVELEAIDIAHSIDKWMAVQKDSLYEIAENMIVHNNYEYDYVQNYLSKANDRNKGNEYYVAFSDKTLVMGSGWIPDKDFDPTARD